MPENDRDALMALLQEASSLLQANQRVRAEATRTLIASLLLAVAGAIVAFACNDAKVILPIPEAMLLLASLAFQQFADVSVLGQARKRLETRVNGILGTSALVYETQVAGIRQHPPLVASVRTLQLVWTLSMAAVTVYATVIAYSAHSAWVPALYTVLTALSVLSCACSYVAMLRAGGEYSDTADHNA